MRVENDLGAYNGLLNRRLQVIEVTRLRWWVINAVFEVKIVV